MGLDIQGFRGFRGFRVVRAAAPGASFANHRYDQTALNLILRSGLGVDNIEQLSLSNIQALGLSFNRTKFMLSYDDRHLVPHHPLQRRVAGQKDLDSFGVETNFGPPTAGWL